LSTCKDEGKGPEKIAYENSFAAKQEILNPDMVIQESFGFDGQIVHPRVYSPKQLEYKTTLLNKELTLRVLRELVTAEKVARRQYDETMLFSLFPNLRPFEPELRYIRNDEKEHELILECIIQRLTNMRPVVAEQVLKHLEIREATQKEIAEGLASKQPTAVLLTKKGLGEMYETILDRFGDEEEKSVHSYEDFIVKIQDNTRSLTVAWQQGKITTEVYNETMTPINELHRKINKHLNEERVYLDVVDAMQEMFSNMKLGKVY